MNFFLASSCNRLFIKTVILSIAINLIVVLATLFQPWNILFDAVKIILVLFFGLYIRKVNQRLLLEETRERKKYVLITGIGFIITAFIMVTDVFSVISLYIGYMFFYSKFGIDHFIMAFDFLTPLICLSVVFFYKPANKIQKLEFQTNSLNKLIEAFQYINHAGIYYDQKDKLIHCIPVEGFEIKEHIFIFKDFMGNFTVDNELAQYSMQELLDAKSRLNFNRPEFDTYLKSIDFKNNSLVVRSESEWSEEKKQDIYRVAGIKNVIFTVGEDNESNFDAPPVFSTGKDIKGAVSQ